MGVIIPFMWINLILLTIYKFNPNRLLDHNVSRILVFVLFPNIFYFLAVILSVFAT